MRGKGWVYSVVMTAVSLVLASPPGFAGDSASKSILKVGYVVITPATPYSGGLAVFETFGERRGSETIQAAVLGGGLTSNAVLFVGTDDHLLRNVGVAITNPNPVEVIETLTLRDDTGAPVATKTVKIPALNQTSTFVTQMFADKSPILRKFAGTLTISSSLPVGIVGLRFRGSNFSTIPVTSLTPTQPVPVIAAGVGGGGAMVLSQFAEGEAWATEIVIANTGSTAVTVRLDFFDQTGKPMDVDLNGQVLPSFQNIKIVPGGLVIMAHQNPDGDSDF